MFRSAKVLTRGGILLTALAATAWLLGPSPESLRNVLRDPQGVVDTDGPDAVYRATVLPASARDVDQGGPQGSAFASAVVDDAVLTLYREPLRPTDDVFGLLPAPRWTDGTGTHGENQALSSIGIQRTPWPPVPGAPATTDPARRR